MPQESCDLEMNPNRFCAFKCINTDGSFECECDKGLTGSGLQDRTYHRYIIITSLLRNHDVMNNQS